MNAKDQFLTHVQNKPIFCAEFYILKQVQKKLFHVYETHHIKLPVDWDETQWNEMLSQLQKFTYNSPQDMISGTIWYHDLTWSEKENSPKSEWRYLRYPKVPRYLY